MEWLEFGVKPSSYMSSLCYSVLRLEPFTTCSYGCIYCYARWYRGPHGSPGVKWHVARWFEKLASRLSGDLPPPMFRLSTLSDPFQHVGGRVPGVVKAVLRTAARHGVPLIVNTKGPLRDPELLPLLQTLADRGLVLVQVTLPVVEEAIAAALEPGAPSPRERLEIIELLAEHAVPVTVRVQPLIPGLEHEHVRAAVEALEKGAMGVIAEPLRETLEGLARVYRVLGLSFEPGLWEEYQLGREEGREPLYHPKPWWRRMMHAALEQLAASKGRPYAPCKDMLLTGFKWFRPGRTCCLEWLGLREQPLLRPTLHEYAALEWPQTPPWALCGQLGWPYTCTQSELEKYPKPVRRALKLHMNKLWRLIETGKAGELIAKLA